VRREDLTTGCKKLYNNRIIKLRNMRWEGHVTLGKDKKNV
jgi:hypothetical protein